VAQCILKKSPKMWPITFWKNRPKF
jgi:hypothetical protein